MMKKIINPLALTLVIGFNSCKEEKQTKTEMEDNDEIDIPVKEKSKQVDENCYLYVGNKDSISMTYTVIEDRVTGKMKYNFFEKDGSFGDFIGEFRGDTIFGTFDIEAEGMRSTREFIFLKQEDELLSGSANVVQNGNKETFEPGAEFKFDSFKMQEADCEDLNFDWELTTLN